MTFLEKYQALKESIPIPAVRVTDNENCYYVDYTHHSKDCYHVFVGLGLNNSAYCFLSGVSQELIDCNFCGWSELCYECVECIKCYQSTYLSDCTNCRDCHFCSMCVSCSDCFGCVALTRKQYCIFNRQYSKAEYEKKIVDLRKKNPEEILKKLNKLIKKIPYPQSFQRNNVNCPYGDYLTNSKNIYWGFNTYWLENSGYVFYGGAARDCWDMTFGGGGGKSGTDVSKKNMQLCYEITGGGNDYNCAFLEYCSRCKDCFYCSNLRDCSDCFGCVGLTNKQYCVLNNQLTKEQYEKAVRTIREELGWETPQVYHEKP